MMTDPASAVQREVHQLVDSLILTLRQSALTEMDLLEYRDRAERIQNLYSVRDRIANDSVPKWHPRLRVRHRRSVSGRD